ncbi:MAG: hypothetical protein LLG44_12690, partial [Chloroflexi bacterium]|nr:hypothetical protein [Chloroflexota bacterium]
VSSLALGLLLSLSGCFLFDQVEVPTLAANATVVVDAEALTAAAGATPSATRTQTKAPSTAGPTATASATPTATAEPSATPKPTVKPSPMPDSEEGCAVKVDLALQAAYSAAGGYAKLGCPAAPAADEQWAFQPYEHGIMFWRGPEKAVYLAHEDSTFQIRADLWDETVPEQVCVFTPPEGFLQPKRGFGLLWCEEPIRTSFGWAALEEASVNYRVQRFANTAGDFALLAVPAWGHAYAFYTDYTWLDVMTINP